MPSQLSFKIASSTPRHVSRKLQCAWRRQIDTNVISRLCRYDVPSSNIQSSKSGCQLIGAPSSHQNYKILRKSRRARYPSSRACRNSGKTSICSNELPNTDRNRDSHENKQDQELQCIPLYQELPVHQQSSKVVVTKANTHRCTDADQRWKISSPVCAKHLDHVIRLSIRIVDSKNRRSYCLSWSSGKSSACFSVSTCTVTGATDLLPTLIST
jgi:hypothetical protein